MPNEHQSSSEESIQLDTEPQFPPQMMFMRDKLTLQYMSNESDFTILEFDRGVKILQSINDPSVFKMMVLLPKSDLLANLVTDPEAITIWNRLIQSANVMFVLNDLKVIRLMFKSFGLFYKTRMTEYSIYKYEEDDVQYILQTSTPSSYHALWLETANLAYGIHTIIPIQKKQLLVYELKFNFRGYVNADQNKSMVVDWLKQYSNLKHYMKSLDVKSQIENEINLSLNNYKSFVHRQTISFDQILIQRPNQVNQFLQMDTPEKLRELFEVVRKQEHYERQIHHYQLNCVEVQAQLLSRVPHYFYGEDWVIDDKKGVLKFINQQKLANQKKVLMFLLKKFGQNLFSGKSLTTISLPLYIFEKRSNLERQAHAFSYAPKFLEAGAKHLDPVEQLKCTFTFALSTAILSCSLDKPFNPILGETYQGWLNGCPIYIEQVSHHPPVCAFYLVGRGYKLHGHYEAVANMGATCITGRAFGYIQVDYDNGTTNRLELSNVIINGMAFGDRTFYMDGNTWVVDEKNKLIASVVHNPSQGMFNKRKTMDYYEGHIYRVDDQHIAKYKREGYRKYNGVALNSTYEKISRLEGRWDIFQQIDGKTVFHVDEDLPYRLINDEAPLASDSLYREDIIAWKLDDFDFAMQQKEMLEQLQRGDRKLRHDKHDK